MTSRIVKDLEDLIVLVSKKVRLETGSATVEGFAKVCGA